MWSSTNNVGIVSCHIMNRFVFSPYLVAFPWFASVLLQKCNAFVYSVFKQVAALHIVFLHSDAHIMLMHCGTVFYLIKFRGPRLNNFRLFSEPWWLVLSSSIYFHVAMLYRDKQTNFLKPQHAYQSFAGPVSNSTCAELCHHRKLFVTR